MTERLTADQAPEWVRRRVAGGTGTRWVGVDGRGAAGKTTLARAVAAAVPDAVVVSVDDFARPGTATWDHARFVSEVLGPLLAGRPARYQHWDLVADVGRDWQVVPPGRVVVVEGVSSTDSRVPVPWDLTIWVDAPADVRWARIQERDSPALLDRWRREWLPSEERYVAEQRPDLRADVVVGYLEERHFPHGRP